MARTIACPSCGAPRSLRNPGIAMFVCEHCSTPVYWDEEAVRAAGTKSRLSEGFTRLYRDATGSYLSHRFRVLGRARYSWGSVSSSRGFWDEWFLQISDGSQRWLTEDDHELSIQSPVDLEGTRPFEDYRVNTWIEHRGTHFLVEETGTAECVGLEGALPEVFELGETYPYVDASSPDGRYNLSLEFDAEKASDPPTVFAGRWLDHADLELDDEGESW